MLLLALIACGSAPPLVLGASSTEPATEQALASYGSPVRASYGATSTLVRQVEAGSTVSVLIGASPEWTDRLDPVRQGTIAANSLVLVASERVPAWSELGEAPCLAIGDPEHVPAGRYARQALEAAGLWQTLADRIVPTQDGPAAARAVRSGACEVGLVYQTDAARSGLKLGDSPPEPPVIRYPVLQLIDDAPSAAIFDHLSGEAGQAAFAAHGFTAP
ncbi:MAG: molybdate ABC transporter substrate-binding protein [Proteobacteria bacterium]|nr:molybdate ABC transporter substrate-binding protein [Pseudomonadota bacterium]